MSSINERKFWMRYEYIDTETNRYQIRTSMIVSDSVESAIKESFGVFCKPASVFSFDICTQEEGEAGYRYWWAKAQ